MYHQYYSLQQHCDEDLIIIFILQTGHTGIERLGGLIPEGREKTGGTVRFLLYPLAAFHTAAKPKFLCSSNYSFQIKKSGLRALTSAFCAAGGNQRQPVL